MPGLLAGLLAPALPGLFPLWRMGNKLLGIGTPPQTFTIAPSYQAEKTHYAIQKGHGDLILVATAFDA